MKINIIAVGKLQKDFEKLFNNYKKKSLYAVINIIEIREQNHDNKELQKTKETKLILNKIPKKSKVFLCSLLGKQYDSIEFSNKMDESNITFVIGGSNGVIEKEFANKITFSKMTFPHQLFRVMLIEQIFRSLLIKNNSKYHK